MRHGVVVGGGIIGTSVAYHLTKLGWKDVVLLERDQLTSGQSEAVVLFLCVHAVGHH